MSHTSDEDKGVSTSIKSGKRCYKCNVAIYFTSKEAETPSGKPTKDLLTGKVIPLDPTTSEYHECKPEDIEAYRATDEHKKKIEEWLSTQKSGQEVVGSSNSYTSASSDTSSSHDATNKNNSMSLTLEKIMTGINHINAFLEQMHTDFKAEIADIKNQLKISTPEHLNEDKKLKMEEK